MGGLEAGSERADAAAVPGRWPGAHTMGEAGRTGSAPAEPRMRGPGSEEWRVSVLGEAGPEVGAWRSWGAPGAAVCVGAAGVPAQSHVALNGSRELTLRQEPD